MAVSTIGGAVEASAESPGGFIGVVSTASALSCSIGFSAVKKKNNRPPNEYVGL